MRCKVRAGSYRRVRVAQLMPVGVRHAKAADVSFSKSNSISFALDFFAPVFFGFFFMSLSRVC
jgi:hypothetical protein